MSGRKRVVRSKMNDPVIGVVEDCDAETCNAVRVRERDGFLIPIENS